MKCLNVLLWIFLFSSISFARPACYQATNPKVITIKELEGSGKQENAKTAQAVWQSQSTVHDGTTMPPNIKLKAQSKNLRFSTWAFQMDPQKPGNYYVECDGGMLTLRKVGDHLILNSERLDGDLASSTDEGCAMGEIHFKDLSLKKVMCPR